MRLQVVVAVLLAGCGVQEAHAADMTREPVSRRIAYAAPVYPERAIARLVDQGLGYSVLHEAIGAPQPFYRVHVTCTLTETFRQVYCPTPAYESYCPSATIVCR